MLCKLFGLNNCGFVLLAFLKLMWRATMYTQDGVISSTLDESFNMKGCLPEVIGMASSIIVWPLLTYIVRAFQKRS